MGVGHVMGGVWGIGRPGDVWLLDSYLVMLFMLHVDVGDKV